MTILKRQRRQLHYCCYILCLLAATPCLFLPTRIEASSPTPGQKPINKKKKVRRLPFIEPRIVGGDSVEDAFQYPFFAHLIDTGCGASLIHDDILLTAAHCEDTDHPFEARTFLLGLNQAEGIYRTIEQQVSHPLYHGDMNDFDYMLLKLSSSALVQEADGLTPTGAQVIGLNRDRNIPQTGDPLMAVGFGKLSEDTQRLSSTLQEVEIYYVSDDTCTEQYSVRDFLPDIMFCAGVEGGGKDTCQGDSGGPIIDKASGLQVGVVSFGVGCAREDYAGVNARVSGAIDWLEAMICELTDYPTQELCGTNATNTMPMGSGGLTVMIEYDQYPREVAWRITHQDSDTQFYFQPFGEATDEEAFVEHSFDQLPPGRYVLEFGDNQEDGICCSYGQGGIYVADISGDIRWSHEGDYDAYLQVVFDMDTQGNIVAVSETTDYENSWESYDTPNHPPTYDQRWPGQLPEADRYTVAINVAFDAYPEEVTWQFSSYVSGDWRTITGFDGEEDGVHNEVVTEELDTLSPGWYRYAIQDTQGDGICCDYRRGWISITAPIITTRDKGLVWGNNGEFGSSFDMFLRIDDEGFVDRVSYNDPYETTSTTGTSRRRHPHEIDDRRQRRRAQLSSLTDLPHEQL